MGLTARVSHPMYHSDVYFRLKKILTSLARNPTYPPLSDRGDRSIAIRSMVIGDPAILMDSVYIMLTDIRQTSTFGA